MFSGSELGAIMLETMRILSEREPDEWAQRSAYWLERSEAAQPKRKRREKATAPLIFTGLNISMRVEKQTLIIRDGTTHYPQAVREYQFFKGSMDLPPRIVLIDGSGSITLDAIDWLTEHKVALIRIKFDGYNTVVMSPAGYAADPKKVAWQYATRSDAKAKLKFATDLTVRKLAASVETLEGFVPRSKYRDSALRATFEALKFIKAGNATTPSILLGQEGKAAAAYWRAWTALEMKWRTSKRYPIPDAWREYRSRSSVNSGNKMLNRNADHPINAMLNYGYAALATKMKIQAIADGFDPMVGVFHDQRHDKKDNTASFALDLMEPHRPVVDRAILKLIGEETFSGADFDLQSNGIVRLNLRLARFLVTQIDALKAMQISSKAALAGHVLHPRLAKLRYSSVANE